MVELFPGDEHNIDGEKSKSTDDTQVLSLKNTDNRSNIPGLFTSTEQLQVAFQAVCAKSNDRNFLSYLRNLNEGSAELHAKIQESDTLVLDLFSGIGDQVYFSKIALFLSRAYPEKQIILRTNYPDVFAVSSDVPNLSIVTDIDSLPESSCVIVTDTSNIFQRFNPQTHDLVFVAEEITQLATISAEFADSPLVQKLKTHLSAHPDSELFTNDIHIEQHVALICQYIFGISPELLSDFYDSSLLAPAKEVNKQVDIAVVYDSGLSPEKTPTLIQLVRILVAVARDNKDKSLVVIQGRKNAALGQNAVKIANAVLKMGGIRRENIKLYSDEYPNVKSVLMKAEVVLTVDTGFTHDLAQEKRRTPKSPIIIEMMGLVRFPENRNLGISLARFVAGVDTLLIAPGPVWKIEPKKVNTAIKTALKK